MATAPRGGPGQPGSCTSWPSCSEVNLGRPVPSQAQWPSAMPSASASGRGPATIGGQVSRLTSRRGSRTGWDDRQLLIFCDSVVRTQVSAGATPVSWSPLPFGPSSFPTGHSPDDPPRTSPSFKGFAHSPESGADRTAFSFAPPRSLANSSGPEGSGPPRWWPHCSTSIPKRRGPPYLGDDAPRASYESGCGGRRWCDQARTSTIP